MKLCLLVVKSSREPWHDELRDLYTKKIKGFVEFEVQELKSKAIGRDRSDEKVQLEDQQILGQLDSSDLVIAFDERGKQLRDSKEFAAKLQSWMEAGKRRVVFVVGGAYGLGPKLKERADVTLSLSPFTFNHFLAQAVVLEQIYRGLTIVRGIPYHN